MHFFLESLVLVLVLLFAPGARASAYNVTCDDVTNPATCYGVCELKRDECHCVRENRNKKCPKKPKIGYEQDIIDALKSQQARNPFTLLNGCNPFFDPTCQTVPPLADVSPKESTEGKKQDVPVCGIKYDESDDPLGRNLRAKSASLLAKSAQKIDGDCPAFYTLQTYENLVEASRDGAFVTHLGACGLCSTTNDLAVYMETPNYESALVACFLSNYDLNSGVFPTPAQIGASILCMVQNVGFTIPCAQILVYNTLAVLVNCLPLCGSFLSGSFIPNDSDCNLNPCLACESVTSLPTFSRFAGRRRGFSGILTGTVRNCSEFANIEHEPCSTKFKRSDYTV